MEKLYKVIMTGEMFPGFEETQVVAKLMQVFTIDQATAQGLLQQQTIIKKHVSISKAQVYQAQLRLIGVQSRLEEETSPPPSSEDKPRASSDASEGSAANDEDSESAAPAEAAMGDLHKVFDEDFLQYLEAQCVAEEQIRKAEQSQRALGVVETQSALLPQVLSEKKRLNIAVRKSFDDEYETSPNASEKQEKYKQKEQEVLPTYDPVLFAVLQGEGKMLSFNDLKGNKKSWMPKFLFKSMFGMFVSIALVNLYLS